MRKKYSIKRMFFYQDELTYEEDGLAKESLKTFEAAFDSEQKQFGQIIEKIYNSGVVPDLFRIILKPYQPTFVHKLWNAFWARYYHLDRSQIVRTMKNSEIAAVIGDFFLLNTSWMGSSGPSGNGSVGSLKLPTPLTSLFARMRSFTSLQKETTAPASG
jgi:hypothetical protein